MANTTDGRSHNQPSHEASVKGGENSHKNTSGTTGSEHTGQSGSQTSHQPSHEASVKGGEHSHSGGK